MASASETRFARIVAGAFLAISLAKVFTHEPWRDEWGPWGIALANDGLRQLWDSLAYEGHARLWYFVVFALERVTGRFESVQILSAAAATIAVWVVTRYAPFARWTRAVFALGYYPLFEYGSLARPYSIALAATCVAAAVFARSRREPLPLAAALVVLAQTTMYGVILAVAFGAAWLADQWKAAAAERARPGRVAIASVLVAGSLLAAVAQMVPPRDSTFAAGWHTQMDTARAGRVAATVVRAIAPLPRPELHFWNTHVLDRYGRTGAVLGVAMLVALALALARSPAALALWITATAGLLAFEYAKYEGYARHQGHLFLAFTAAAWLAMELRGGAAASRGMQAWLLPAALGVIVAVNAAAGVMAVAMDAALPFSTATAAAREIGRLGLADARKVGLRGSTTAAVAAALEEPITFAGTRRTSTFVRWDRSYHVPPQAKATEEARRLSLKSRSPVLLILDHRLEVLPADVQWLASMEESIVRDEQFHLYLVAPWRGSGPSPRSAQRNSQR